MPGLQPKQRPTRQWHRGKGVLEPNWVLRTMLSREKQGLQYAGGFLEPIAPLSLPCGALLNWNLDPVPCVRP